MANKGVCRSLLSTRLCEVEAKAFFNTEWKFSKSFWLIGGRLLWYMNLLVPEKKKETVHRARRVIEMLENDQGSTILLITHGLFLKVLTKELKKQGYSGEVDIKPKNGQIYHYRKS